MSINAIVEGVSILSDETVKLHLGPYNDDPVGQQSLIVDNPPNPPEALRGLIGEHIWGGCGHIVHGETVLADRKGYVHIQLREKPQKNAPQRIRQEGTEGQRGGV